MKPAISIQNATFSYETRPVFSNIHLTLENGRWAALLGESGVGKTTLLKYLAGLLPSKNHDLPSCAYMGQTDLLLPWKTVLQNVLLGTLLRDQKQMQQTIAAAKTLLSNVGLEEMVHCYPHQLSGGMRSRAALVRTLLEDKPLVLMDEPFSALDAITRYKLQTLTADLLQDKTVFFVTHDPTEALRLADDIYILQKHPNQLKHVVHLTSARPRSLTHPDLLNWQPILFDALADAI